MNNFYSSRITVTAIVLTLALTVPISGCLLGLGAAAGAAVGGCSILDADQDDRVTRQELSSGLFDAWDTNDNDSLTEAEFESGVNRGDVFEPWSDNFDDWDDDDDDTLTETEFDAGVADDEEAAGWMDSQCDDLGL